LLEAVTMLACVAGWSVTGSCAAIAVITRAKAITASITASI
jgi:hypothetical protein